MICTKKGYDTHRQAAEVINGFKRRNNRAYVQDKIPKRAYYCHKCGKFHLTSLKRKKGKKRIKSNF